MADEGQEVGPARWTPARIGVVLGATLALAAVGWFNRSDFDALGELTPAAAIIVVGVQVLYLFPQSYRYRLITESHADLRIDGLAWFRIFSFSTLLNNFVMQSGLVYQSTALRREAGLKLGAYLGSYAIAGWLSMLVNLVLAAVLLGALSPGVHLGPGPAWLSMAVLAVAVAVAPIALHRLTRAFGSGNRFVRAGSQILRSAVDLPRRPAFAVRFLVSSGVTALVGGAGIVAAAKALDVPVGIGEAMLFLALVQMASLVSITPGNIGIRELAFSVVGSALEAGAANGLLISTLMRATGVVALAMGGSGAWVLEQLRAHRRADPSVSP